MREMGVKKKIVDERKSAYHSARESFLLLPRERKKKTFSRRGRRSFQPTHVLRGRFHPRHPETLHSTISVKKVVSCRVQSDWEIDSTD